MFVFLLVIISYLLTIDIKAKKHIPAKNANSSIYFAFERIMVSSLVSMVNKYISFPLVVT